MDLNNRDVAFLVWAALGTVAVLAWPPGRAAIGGVVAALRGKLLVVALLYAGYYALVVAGAQQIGFWNTGLVRDTLAWFFLGGLPLLAKFPDTYKQPRVYRRALRRLVTVSVLIEFLISLTAFSFGFELLLLPTAVVLGVLSTFAAIRPEYASAKRVFDALLAVVGFGLLGMTLIKLAQLASTLDPRQLGLLVLLPVWATVFTLVFVFLFGLYANYEPKMREINETASHDRRARWRSKAALITEFWTRNVELGRFTPFDARELARATSWAEARRYVTYKRAEIRLELATVEFRARRLARYAGVTGMDWEGRPLDQREFQETKDALDHLRAFHSAQYRNGRYRTDLMTMVGGLLSKTFPESEIVMTIGPKGRSWWAWRRSVSGWVFGIGAAGGPPDEWTWEGPEPPERGPGPGTDWTHRGFDEDEAA
jgi:hypothetical protein